MRRVHVAVLLAALAFWPSMPSKSWAAACASACKDEIASCAAQECPGLKPAAARRCKRIKCTKPIVHDCYQNLSVCGATRARPPGTGSSPAPGGGGGW